MSTLNRRMWKVSRAPRRTLCNWAVIASFALLGCEKKAPPDPHIAQGYQLLKTNPQAAYDALGEARDASASIVLLGRGLALERLRRFEEAEVLFRQAASAGEGQDAWFALGRVRVVLGKPGEARSDIDRAVALAPGSLPILFLEGCLADGPERARAALAHLDNWRALTRQKNKPVPAEFFLLQRSLFRQLEMRSEFEAAEHAASTSGLFQSGGSLAWVELAVKTGRQQLALELLRKTYEHRPPEHVKRQIGLLAFGLGEYKLTGRVLDSILAQDAEILVLRAEYQVATRDAQASLSLVKALQADVTPAVRRRLRTLLLEALLRSGQSDRARQEAEALLHEGPSEAATHFLVRLELGEGTPERALRRLRPLLLNAPASKETRRLAARAELEAGHPDQARALLDSLLEEDPTETSPARLRVALEVDAGKAPEALRVAQSLVSRAPANAGLRLLVADAAYAVGGREAGIESLRASVRDIAQEAGLWIALVQALDEAGRGPEALKVLEEAHSQLPQDLMLSAALAGKLAEEGQSQRAAALYERLIESAKTDPVALNNLAVIYSDELKQPARAVQLAELAYGLTQAPPIADTLGWALYRRGTAEDLQRSLELLQAVRHKLSSPSSKLHLGAVLLATGAEAEGHKLLKQALSQSHDFSGAAEARLLLGGQ